MKQYRIVKMNCSTKEREHLQAIGVSEDTVIELLPDNDKNNICMLTVDQSVFCIRKELFNLLEIEEL